MINWLVIAMVGVLIYAYNPGTTVDRSWGYASDSYSSPVETTLTATPSPAPTSTPEPTAQPTVSPVPGLQSESGGGSTATPQNRTVASNTPDEAEGVCQSQHERDCASPEGIAWPVGGSITTYYSGWHLGIDIGAGCGVAVGASSTGTVTFAGWFGGYGNLVIISGYNGVTTYYGHLGSIWVWYGERVEIGQGIGAVGTTGYSTGCHLHFETLVNGWYTNPLAVLN